jgi:hypothetical protein
MMPCRQSHPLRCRSVHRYHGNGKKPVSGTELVKNLLNLLFILQLTPQVKPWSRHKIETGLLSDDPRLADTYLKATAGYLSLYENQFGPYPFPKFAIVENFFPTG